VWRSCRAASQPSAPPLSRSPWQSASALSR
jgi:hypothetical protein